MPLSVPLFGSALFIESAELGPTLARQLLFKIKNSPFYRFTAASACVLLALLTAPVTQAQLLTPACAWPVSVNNVTLRENPQLNVYNPDTAAAYWLMPFIVQDGLRITVSGVYPDARYMSVAVYDADGTPFSTNGVASTLTDYQIMPDPGSVNPWQRKATPGGRFTITLRSDAAPSQMNTLPLAPAGSHAGAINVIFFRLYAAEQEDPRKILLPKIAIALNGVSTEVPACPVSTQDQFPPSFCSIPWVAKESPACQALAASAQDRPSTTANAGKILQFAKYPTGAGGTPDLDIAYMFAGVVPPQNADVLVIHGKAPTTPSGSYPAPWPAPDIGLRYWSLCIDLAKNPKPVVTNFLPDGKVDYGCRHDIHVALDRDGYYTFVVGTEAQRAAIEQIPGATFLPFSDVGPAQAYRLSLRNMLAEPSFAEAVQNVPADGNPASAAKVMGSYYPQLKFCSLANSRKTSGSATDHDSDGDSAREVLVCPPGTPAS